LKNAASIRTRNFQEHRNTQSSIPTVVALAHLLEALQFVIFNVGMRELERG
jgi:hypothetical protein